MKIKEKILNILLVRRPEIQNKWWHRLANVLIYGSTIIVAVSLVCLFISDIFSGNSGWKTYHYTYSFESNYSQAKGEESSCSNSSSGIRLWVNPMLPCGDIYNSETLLTRYAKDNGTYDQLIQKISQSDGSWQSYDQLLNESIKNGDFPNVIKVKKQPVISYTILIEHTLLILLFILLWFIFWESIIYRAAVYVILGKNK